MSIRGLSTSVVVPVYNEQDTVGKCLKRVLQETFIDFVNVVDDGSRDDTWERLQAFRNEPRVRLARHERNQGKGAALRTGFELSREDLLAVQDADLEYNPSELKELFDWVASEEDCIAYGSRYLGKDRHHHSSMAFYLGGQLVTLVTNLLYGTNLTDEPTCYKVFRRHLLPTMKLQCRGFEFCPEFTAKARLMGQRIHELPISFEPRSWEQGKKIRPRDGFEAIWQLIYWRFRGLP